MNDDIRPNGGGENRDGGDAGPAATGRSGAVTSTYTDISGNPVFVIATVDHADAWIAVPQGIELDPEDLR